MHQDPRLIQTAVVALVALVGGLGFARLKQPPILGYILTGFILGPACLEFVPSSEHIKFLAELGVLLLLFMIGMELNLRSFKKVWKIATLCTLIQVIASLSAMSLLSYLFDWSGGMVVLLGFVFFLSSTAVVFKMLESVGEMRSETGHITIGVLIAQDLAIAPMLLMIRNWNPSSLDWFLFVKIIASLSLIVLLIIYLSRKQRVRLPFVQLISGDKELSALTSLTFCFTAAVISAKMGFSGPYGAFLAGLVLGNSNERFSLLESVKPVQSILLMIFFVSIGLLLDLDFIWGNLMIVLVLLFLITIGKTMMNIGILHLLKIPLSQAFLISLLLAQLGEFSFLLTTVGFSADLIDAYGQKLIISLTVLSLLLSPVWLSSARRLKGSLALKGTLMNDTHITLRTVLNWAYRPEMFFVKKTVRYLWHRLGKSSPVLRKPPSLSSERHEDLQDELPRPPSHLKDDPPSL